MVLAHREAYLKVLKRIFELGSAKSAAYCVGMFWALRSVINYQDPHHTSWYEDAVDVRPECSWFELQVSPSPFHQLLAKDATLLRARHLRSVICACEQVAEGD